MSDRPGPAASPIPSAKRWLPYGLVAAALLAALAIWQASDARWRGEDTRTSNERQSLSQRQNDHGGGGDHLSAPVARFPSASPQVDFLGPQSGVEEAIPEEWEPALYEVLTDSAPTPEEGHRRLLEFATRTAVGVPRVQQEALRHLAFRLPTREREAFLQAALSPTVHESLRLEFLNAVLEVRPPELSLWLCQRLVQHHEPMLSAAARGWLEAERMTTAD